MFVYVFSVCNVRGKGGKHPWICWKRLGVGTVGTFFFYLPWVFLPDYSDINWITNSSSDRSNWHTATSSILQVSSLLSYSSSQRTRSKEEPPWHSDCGSHLWWSLHLRGSWGIFRLFPQTNRNVDMSARRGTEPAAEEGALAHVHPCIHASIVLQPCAEFWRSVWNSS